MRIFRSGTLHEIYQTYALQTLLKVQTDLYYRLKYLTVGKYTR